MGPRERAGTLRILSIRLVDRGTRVMEDPIDDRRDLIERTRSTIAGK